MAFKICLNPQIETHVIGSSDKNPTLLCKMPVCMMGPDRCLVCGVGSQVTFTGRVPDFGDLADDLECVEDRSGRLGWVPPRARFPNEKMIVFEKSIIRLGGMKTGKDFHNVQLQAKKHPKGILWTFSGLTMLGPYMPQDCCMEGVGSGENKRYRSWGSMQKNAFSDE